IFHGLVVKTPPEETDLLLLLRQFPHSRYSRTDWSIQRHKAQRTLGSPAPSKKHPSSLNAYRARYPKPFAGTSLTNLTASQICGRRGLSTNAQARATLLERPVLVVLSGDTNSMHR